MSNVSDWYLEQEAGSQLVNSICPVAQNNSSLQHLCDPKCDIPNLCLGKYLNLKCNFLFLLILRKSVGQTATPPYTEIIPLQFK